MTRRTMWDDPVPLHPGVGHRVLDVAVLNGLGVDVGLKVAVGRVGKDLVHPPPAGARGQNIEAGVPEDVVRVLVVDGRRPRGHGRLRVGVDGVLLIGHLDGLQGVLGGDLVLRHHHGDILPVDAHPLGQQLPVGHVLMGGLHAPGVAGGGILDVGYVKAGEDLHHPGHLLCLGEVHVLHHAVCNGAVEDPGHQDPLAPEIVGIFRPAGHLVQSVHPVDTSSNFHKSTPPVMGIISHIRQKRKRKGAIAFPLWKQIAG